MLNAQEAQELHGNIGEALELLAHLTGPPNMAGDAGHLLRRARELAAVLVSDTNEPRYGVEAEFVADDIRKAKLDVIESGGIVDNGYREVLTRIAHPDKLADPEVERDYFSSLARSVLRFT